MTQFTEKHRRDRAIFTLASLVQLTISGTVYAFPIWVIFFKGVFGITQTQTNVLGIAVYISVSMIGFQVAVKVLGVLKPWQTTFLFTVASMIGFALLYLVCRGTFNDDGNSLLPFIMVSVAIVFIMVSLAVLYTLFFGLLLNQFWGRKNLTWVNGSTNVMFAFGGVLGGCLFYFSSMSTEYDFLVLCIVQSVAVPLMTAAVYSTTKHPFPPVEHINLANDAEIANANSTERDTLLQDNGRQDAVLEVDEPEGLGAWLRATLSSPKYYIVILILFVKVGIGGTFTTNLGSIVTASLDPDTPDDEVDKKISLAVIYLNIAQLTGRLLYTFLGVLKANPNMITMLSVAGVAVLYIACFLMQILMEHTYRNVLIMTCAFGIVYGAMWCTSSALIAFVPLNRNVSRALAVTQPFGGLGNIILNLLAGHLYDKHTYPGTNTCYGNVCYHESDLIMMGFSAALLLLSMVRIYYGIPDRNGKWKI